MQFEEDHLYHIYNRGNNSQQIYFHKKNYLFFLEKIKKYILPHADIIAWCLMPNHFHLMVYVHQVEVISEESMSSSREGFTSSEALSKKRTLNQSIGIMLRSYTRAIQKQEKLTGSLFQKNTKAICLTKVEGITPAWFQSKYGTVINVDLPEKAYPQTCFSYIHRNPVKHGLVIKSENWEFSSYRDYINKRDGKLFNKEKTREFGLILE